MCALRASQPATAGERGQATILMTLLLVALIGAAALSVDIGRGALAQFRMQAATDAAALAGATALPANPGTAVTLAQQYADTNGAPASTVSVSPDAREITVRAAQTLPTVLAPVLGILGIPVAVVSHARSDAYPACAGAACQPSYSVPPGGGDSAPSCPQVYINGGYQCVPPGGDQFGLAPLYADISVVGADFASGGCAWSAAGCAEYELKSGTDGGGDGSNRGALSLSGNGASDFENDLADGYQGALHIGDTLTTKPGVMQGPTDGGMQALCASDGQAPFVIVPLTATPGNGRQTLQVLGFAAVALQCPGNGDGSIFGRFVAAVLPTLGTVVGTVDPSAAFGLLARAGLTST